MSRIRACVALLSLVALAAPLRPSVATAATDAAAGPTPVAAAVPPAALASPAALAPISVGDVIAARPLTGNPPSAFLWSPHGVRYVYRVPADTEGGVATERVVDLATGRDRLLLAAKALSRGTRSRPIDQIAWSPDDTRVALVNGGTLEVVDVRSGKVVPVEPAPSGTAGLDADDPQFSPNGTSLAFVRGGDLYVADLEARGSAPRRLTSDGGDSVLNGDPDWLYSEELDVQHGYAWSPDGAAIAYLRFDDRPVAPFPIQDYTKAVNTVESQRYPLAGAKNPKVSLRVLDVAGDRPASRVLYDGAPHDEYLVSFAWTPDGAAVVDEILDRPQRHARLVRFARSGGAARTLAAESDARFVDVQPAPRPLADGRTTLALSGRGGVQGLDRIDAHGGVRRLTGAMPVSALLGVDEKRRMAYVEALVPTRRDRALVAVPLGGGRPSILTKDPGFHAFAFPANGGTAYVDTASSLDLPPIVRRRPLAGGPAEVLFTTPSLAGRALATTTAVTVPSPEGPLDATLTVPASFDQTKKYPVLVTVYGGPLPVGDHLSDEWPGLEPTLLAERGVLTLHVEAPAERDDRRSYEGTYTNAMGAIAIEGPLAAAKWLATQPYADAARLGLFGWSYGGYLTAFTMTHERLYKSGIAGAPVTDFRLYDTAYSERYLGDPRRSSEAYRRASDLGAAQNLSGTLLVVHGTSDDNVHLANTIAFVNACIQAGRPVETFFLPGARHGPTGFPSKRYLETMMLDWWTRTL